MLKIIKYCSLPHFKAKRIILHCTRTSSADSKEKMWSRSLIWIRIVFAKIVNALRIDDISIISIIKSDCTVGLFLAGWAPITKAATFYRFYCISRRSAKFAPFEKNGPINFLYKVTSNLIMKEGKAIIRIYQVAEYIFLNIYLQNSKFKIFYNAHEKLFESKRVSNSGLSCFCCL